MIDTVQLEPHTCTARRHNVNCFETTVHQGCNQTAFYSAEYVKHVIIPVFLYYHCLDAYLQQIIETAVK